MPDHQTHAYAPTHTSGRIDINQALKVQLSTVLSMYNSRAIAILLQTSDVIVTKGKRGCHKTKTNIFATCFGTQCRPMRTGMLYSSILLPVDHMNAGSSVVSIIKV
ncbi:hypothetical protein NP493_490g02000 [Ridgeia piscesae]|uniref:Uncharacterized protein n=1 Tax=Ridgeia piscesae TaxID=27915 RepID=A0AAD9KY36_RIDPI|nr:hypothetical protein NP493_490g02000 [Ridgeia piscesae]